MGKIVPGAPIYFLPEDTDSQSDDNVTDRFQPRPRRQSNGPLATTGSENTMAPATPGAVANAASAPATTPAARVPSQPVQILAAPAAQAYSHVHPVLILAVFCLRFGALVEDPSSTLLSILPVVAALQGVYVVLCLPPAGRGSSTSPNKGDGAIRAGKKRTGDTSGGNTLGRKVVAAALSLALPLLLGTPILTILLILFGAPATTHLPHTVFCAAHMAVLAGTSLVHVHGTDGQAWHEIWGFSRVLDTVWTATVGTALGAWLGAVPIPLDWDRPWQAYPITIITGAYIGYAVGCVIGRSPLLYGKKIQFTAEEAEEDSAGQSTASAPVH